MMPHATWVGNQENEEPFDSSKDKRRGGKGKYLLKPVVEGKLLELLTERRRSTVAGVESFVHWTYSPECYA